MTDEPRRRPVRREPTPPKAPAVTSADSWAAPVTGFRAIAAVAVAMGHSFLQTRMYPISGVVPIIGVIVPMFFVVSAYALYRPFVVDQIQRRRPRRARDFWWRRLLRIYPLYVVALTTYLVFIPPLRPDGGALLDYVKLYTFLQVYFPNLNGSDLNGLAGIPAAWFLCDEVAFYLMIPGLAYLAFRWAVWRNGGRRPSTEAILRSHVKLAIVMWVIAFVTRPIAIARMGLPGVALPTSNLDFYGLGILISVGTLWEREGLPLPEVAIWLRERPWVAAGGMLVGAAAIQLAATDPAVWTDQQNIFRYLMWTVMTVPIMVYLLMGDQRSRANTWLSDRRWVWLAALSLHVYLWHQFVLGAFNLHVRELADLLVGNRFTTGLLVAVGCAVVTIALSAALRPALDWPYSQWAGPGRTATRRTPARRPPGSRPTRPPTGSGRRGPGPSGDRSAAGSGQKRRASPGTTRPEARRGTRPTRPAGRPPSDPRA